MKNTYCRWGYYTKYKDGITRKRNISYNNILHPNLPLPGSNSKSKLRTNKVPFKTPRLNRERFEGLDHFNHMSNHLTICSKCVGKRSKNSNLRLWLYPCLKGIIYHLHCFSICLWYIVSAHITRAESPGLWGWWWACFCVFCLGPNDKCWFPEFAQTIDPEKQRLTRQCTLNATTNYCIWWGSSGIHIFSKS